MLKLNHSFPVVPAETASSLWIEVAEEVASIPGPVAVSPYPSVF